MTRNLAFTIAPFNGAAAFNELLATAPPGNLSLVNSTDRKAFPKFCTKIAKFNSLAVCAAPLGSAKHYREH